MVWQGNFSCWFAQFIFSFDSLRDRPFLLFTNTWLYIVCTKKLCDHANYHVHVTCFAINYNLFCNCIHSTSKLKMKTNQRLWLLTTCLLIAYYLYSCQIKGHHFVSTHYTSPTFCNHCSGLLWGIGDQGFLCSSMFFIFFSLIFKLACTVSCTLQAEVNGYWLTASRGYCKGLKPVTEEGREWLGVPQSTKLPYYMVFLWSNTDVCSNKRKGEIKTQVKSHSSCRMKCFDIHRHGYSKELCFSCTVLEP